MIYHVLPESEAFSAFKGLALSRTVASILRVSDDGIVVCHDADDTWGFPASRILVIPRMRTVSRVRARQHIPLALAGAYLRRLFKPLLDRLEAGDIVWVHNQPFFAAALARAVHRRGAVILYHSQNSTSAGRPAKALKAADCDAHIFLSQFLRKAMLEVFPGLKNAFIIPNGADEHMFYPPLQTRLESEEPVILYVGRLQPFKGVHVLTAAMKLLEERGITATCRIVGSSHFGNSKTTAYIEELKRTAPPNVHFAQFTVQTRIADQYRDADILCCPSIWQEPFGNVNIEGMACGLPVVASKVGGIPEIAAEGGVILVEPDNPAELADALQALIVDKAYRRKTAEEGLRSFQRRFTEASINHRLKEVVDTLQATVTPA